MARKPRFDIFLSLNEEENVLAEQALVIAQSWKAIFMKGIEIFLKKDKK